MKSDARVRYTKRRIKESLLTLLAQKPINRITVKEVCEAAEINRATFYAHYTDCFDALEQAEAELLAVYEQSLSFTDAADVLALIERIYDLIEQNESIFGVLVFQHKDAEMLSRMIALAHDKTLAQWRTQLTKADENKLEMLFACMANGLASVVLSGYRHYERSDLIAFVNNTVQHLIAPYL